MATSPTPEALLVEWRTIGPEVFASDPCCPTTEVPLNVYSARDALAYRITVMLESNPSRLLRIIPDPTERQQLLEGAARVHNYLDSRGFVDMDRPNRGLWDEGGPFYAPLTGTGMGKFGRNFPSGILGLG